MLKFQQGYTKISLVDASFKDIAFQLRQDEKYTALINNEEGYVGAGLNYQKLVEKAHKAQVARAHAYTNALRHGDAYMEAESVLEDPVAFEPNEMDKHHYVPANSGKGGPKTQAKLLSTSRQRNKVVILHKQCTITLLLHKKLKCKVHLHNKSKE